MKATAGVTALIAVALLSLAASSVNAQATICLNTCRTAGNGICEDGEQPIDNAGAFLQNAENLCDFGTDCDDCGPRSESKK